MTGFFDQLRQFGGAHQRHVEAVRAAITQPDLQTARDGLAAYLQGLSAEALAGFRVSLGVLLAGEGHPQVQQALQWIAANVDGLRAGHFAALTPDRMPRHGLALEQVATLVDTWDRMPPDGVRHAFAQTMNALDARGRAEFAGHCETLAMHAQARAQQLAQDEGKAWGDSFEDRLAYAQARITTGARDHGNAQAQAQQQAIAQALVQLAQAARGWQVPPPPAAAAAPQADDLADFPVDANASEQMAFMRRLLEREKARGRMDPARAAALGDFVEQMTGYLRSEEDRQRQAPADPQDLDARRADLRERMAHVAGLRDRMERFRDMHRDVRRDDEPAAGTRAAAVGARVDALLDDVAGLRSAQLVSTRESEARALEALHLDLVRARARLKELAASDDEVCKYEADALRAIAQAVRMFHRRGHAMLARPLWPGGALRVEPGSVAVVAGDPVRAAVQEACGTRRLDLRSAAQPGVDPATSAWRSLQRAALAVFDLSDGDPQTYYQLGQAYALGTELLLLARRGTRIPFDVAQHIVEYADAADLAARLPEAIDDAVYGVQTPGLSALMHATLARCRDLADKAVGAQAAGVLLAQMEAAVLQPLDFRAALEQFLGQLGNSRLVLLHPRWPAHYPQPGARRCFVVMPFSEQLGAAQAMYRAVDADLSASGVEVVRGDEALGQEIVASIWEETARASHVLVDLTGYNLNVCLELGIADAIGRDSLLVGAPGTSDARFALIDKRRIHHYGDDEASRDALRATVRSFVQRAPTLA